MVLQWWLIPHIFVFEAGGFTFDVTKCRPSACLKVRNVQLLGHHSMTEEYYFKDVQNYSSNKTRLDNQNRDRLWKKKLTFCCEISSSYYKYLVYITREFHRFGSCCYVCTYMYILTIGISPWNRLLSAGDWDHVLYRGWTHWSFYQPPSWINEQPDANALSTSEPHTG